MTFFIDNSRTDLEGYDYCGDDYNDTTVKEEQIEASWDEHYDPNPLDAYGDIIYGMWVMEEERRERDECLANYNQHPATLSKDLAWEQAEKGHQDGDHWVQLNEPELKYAAFSAAEDQPDCR